MLLRNGKIVRIQYSVNIDFNEASTAWLANKIPLGCGTYKYKKETVQTKTTCEKKHTYNLRSIQLKN